MLPLSRFISYPSVKRRLTIGFLSGRMKNSFFPNRRKQTRQTYTVFHKRSTSSLLGRLIFIIIFKMSNKRKCPLSEDKTSVDRLLTTDYSSACFICGVVLGSWEGFSKHKRTHNCSTHLHQLLTAKSMGGSSLPSSINSFVQSERVGYMVKADSYYLEDYNKLKKCIKKAGLASVSKVFDCMLKYISLTEYVNAEHYVNFPLSSFLLHFPHCELDTAPKGRTVINTPSGSIGECIQFLVSFYVPYSLIVN